MESDKEGKFFAAGVDSFVHDQRKKRRLTKYHTKLTHYQLSGHIVGNAAEERIANIAGQRMNGRRP